MCSSLKPCYSLLEYKSSTKVHHLYHGLTSLSQWNIHLLLFCFIGPINSMYSGMFLSLVLLLYWAISVYSGISSPWLFCFIGPSLCIPGSSSPWLFLLYWAISMYSRIFLSLALCFIGPSLCIPGSSSPWLFLLYWVISMHSGILIIIIMSVFLERFSMWNMLNCAEQALLGHLYVFRDLPLLRSFALLGHLYVFWDLPLLGFSCRFYKGALACAGGRFPLGTAKQAHFQVSPVQLFPILLRRWPGLATWCESCIGDICWQRSVVCVLRTSWSGKSQTHAEVQI